MGRDYNLKIKANRALTKKVDICSCGLISLCKLKLYLPLDVMFFMG